MEEEWDTEGVSVPVVEWEGEVEVEMDWVGVGLPRGERVREGLREGEADAEGVLDTFPEGETLPVLVPPPSPPSEVALGDTDWEGVGVCSWLKEGEVEAEGVGVADPQPPPPPPVAQGVNVTQEEGELDPPPPEERGVVDTQGEEEGVEPSFNGLGLGLPVPTAADPVCTWEPV